MPAKFRKTHRRPIRSPYARSKCNFAILLAMCGTAGACSNSTGPLPNLTGPWLGGTPVQLFVSLKQSGTTLTVGGQIAKAGVSDFFGYNVQGKGSVASDSTVRLELDGLGRHQVLKGKLLESGVISGEISGDLIGGDGVQIITLARHSEAPPQS